MNEKYSLLLKNVEKPGRYTGGEFGEQKKEKKEGEREERSVKDGK